MASKGFVSKWDVLDIDNRDLDSAFNDGYQLKHVERSDLIVQWLMFFWVAAAMVVGSFVMARALVHILGNAYVQWVAPYI